MLCSVCSKQTTRAYCSNCSNTSPSLLLKWRMALLSIHEQNRKLQGRVKAILERSMGQNDVDMDGDKNEENDFPLLKSKLRKVTILKMKKRNNRIRFRIEQLKKNMENKKQRATHMEDELQLEIPKEAAIILQDDEDLMERIHQTQKIVQMAQQEKLHSLRKWFMVRQRKDLYLVSFSILFQPIISLQNVPNLPRSVTISSLNNMFQYLDIFAQIINFKLPYDGFHSLTSAKEDGDDNNTDVVEWITKLTIGLLQLASKLQLIRTKSIDIHWLLDQYDVDKLFYSVVQQRQIQCRVISSGQCWTFSHVYAMVSEILNISERNSRNNLRADSTQRHSIKTADTQVAHLDRWFIVG